MIKGLKFPIIINCKEASRIASDVQERPLSLAERFGLFIHLLICKPCVNFNKQLKFMRKAATSANEKFSIKPDKGMSDSARERIHLQLNQK